MIRLKKNEWIFNYRIVNSSNLCIISIFQGWKISMDWKDGTFFFYLYIIISVTHRIVKFLSLLNFTYLDYVFPLFLSLSLRIIGKTSFDIPVSTIYIFAYLIFSKCYFLFFLRAKMQMFVFFFDAICFLIIRKMWKRKDIIYETRCSYSIV